MSKLAELEEKRAAKLAEKAQAEAAQYEIDLEARIDLEDKHGSIAAVKVSRFAPGQPTMALARTPSRTEYKRYKDLMFAAGSGKGRKEQTPQLTQEEMARQCWVYPASKEAQDAMLEAFPGLLTPLSLAAAALAEGSAEDEGKG